MRRFLLALALLAASASAWSAELVLVKTETGHYTLAKDAQGVPKLTKVDLQIVDLTGVTGPEVPAPPPPGTTAFERAIQAQTAGVIQAGGSKTTAAGISAAYSLVSEAVTKGDIPHAKAFDAVKAATDTVLALQPDNDKWTTWRNDLGKALTTLGSQGHLDTKEQVAGILKEISRGIDLATGGSIPKASDFVQMDLDNIDRGDGKADGILDGIDLQRLMELIKFVIEILKLFGITK